MTKIQKSNLSVGGLIFKNDFIDRHERGSPAPATVTKGRPTDFGGLPSFLFPISCLQVLVIGYCNLRFIWNLVLEICHLILNIQRQRHLSLIAAMRSQS